MALELRQQLKLAQKLVMTPQLRQAIKLLQLNRLDLTQALQAEMEQNPALEIDTSPDASSEEKDYGLSTTVEPDTVNARKRRSPSRYPSLGRDGRNQLGGVRQNLRDPVSPFPGKNRQEDAPSQFDFISEKPGLSAYLHWQLAHEELDDQEWEIARYISRQPESLWISRNSLEEIVETVGCIP